MGRSQNTPVDQLTDTEVLELTNNGALGAGIVGKELAERAQRLKVSTNDGQFGPALTDPNYATKQAAKRAAERDAEGSAKEPTDSEGDETGAGSGEPGEGDAVDPWTFVTLSGAKMLAQTAGISYRPGVKRQALIEVLKTAGVIPPAPPADPDADEQPE
jgi:hypothetical protein